VSIEKAEDWLMFADKYILDVKIDCLLCELFEGLTRPLDGLEGKQRDQFFICVLLRSAGTKSRVNKIFEIAEIVRLMHNVVNAEPHSFEENIKIAIRLNRKYTASFQELKDRVFKEIETDKSE